MKIYRTIIEDKLEPSNKNSLWLNNGNLKHFRNNSWEILSSINNIRSNEVVNIKVLTQEEYDSIILPDSKTLYIII